MRAYTRNFVSAPGWGDQYGGLIGATPGNVVKMGWQCSTYTIAGVPVVTRADAPGGDWNYLKDVWDTTTADFPSFTDAIATGYCNIAYGSSAYTTVISPGYGQANNWSTPLADTRDTFYFFTEADFSHAAIDTYSLTLVFEVIHP